TFEFPAHLDGKMDCRSYRPGNHPLTRLLLADYLVVAASKPFTENSYFDIERSMLDGRAHATPGGRWLNQDFMDFIYTLYVTGGKGPAIDHSGRWASAWAAQTVPYLAPPHGPKTR